MIDRGPLSRVLNLVGAAVVVWFLGLSLISGKADVWLWVVSSVSVAAWLVRQLLPDRGPAPLAASLVALAAGSLATVGTNILGFVPGVVCLATVMSDPRVRVWIGTTATGVSAVLVAVAALIGGGRIPLLLGSLAALALAALIGVSRRQARAAALAQRDLLEERVHTAAITERARIARDIHDVLAHSLGALVVQLDAAEAQLEAGRIDGALTRTRSARNLAAEGLDEARRAVDALRESDAADLAAEVGALLETHRALGETVAFHEVGTPRQLDPLTATAFRRAAQELLTNARKHAAGAEVEMTLTWSADAVSLRAHTAPSGVATQLAATGGGRGLAGLRDRFAELPGGRVTVTDDAEGFTVRAEAAA